MDPPNSGPKDGGKTESGLNENLAELVQLYHPAYYLEFLISCSMDRRL